ncbi:hypothetical protein [Intrasporangium flavum]|uniref:hypothetical protein n=1 Tax=Intrasporangium flavum TaxID=1428657 RepID=UPI00096D06F6|nr:hypothetical protein [Intrasporangium flavum]
MRQSKAIESVVRLRLTAGLLTGVVGGVAALAGCSAGGKPLQESCQSFFARYKETNAQVYSADMTEYSKRLGALYGEAAQTGDADAKKVFEPAATAMTAMGNGGPYVKSTRDALEAVTAACAPWAPRS